MPCYKPLNAYRSHKVGKSSKIRFLKSGERIPTSAEYLRIPCGQCIGCRLDRSRQWATRCMHEAKHHENNCFITLTYDQKNIPRDQGLRKSDFQKFMKRLRKHADQLGYKKLKYMHAGEYGDEGNRPHYHACIFGFDFKDKKFFTSRNDNIIYTSAVLSDVWGLGYSSTGNVTWDSAAYVARYCLKKINGPKAELIDERTGLKHYERTHLDTGEICEVIPEYTTMSRNPGLGNSHFNEFGTDIYPHDECIVNGHPTRPPRYYDNLFEINNQDEMEAIRKRRIEVMDRFAPDNTRARLATKEKVKLAQISKLKRGLKHEI